jgi:hypothetical protein
MFLKNERDVMLIHRHKIMLILMGYTTLKRWG